MLKKNINNIVIQRGTRWNDFGLIRDYREGKAQKIYNHYHNNKKLWGGEQHWLCESRNEKMIGIQHGRKRRGEKKRKRKREEKKRKRKRGERKGNRVDQLFVIVYTVDYIIN